MNKVPGLEASIRAKTTSQDSIQFVNSKGRAYATMKQTGDPNQQTLLSEYEIFRDDLSKILHDLTRGNPNVEYVYGEQVSAIHQHSEKGKATVEFQEGKLPTSEFDLVVACDGATGRTRAIGLDCTVRAHINPINMWSAYASIKEDFLDGTQAGKMYGSLGGRALGIGPDPSGGNRACAMAILPRPSATNEDATLPFRTAQKQGDAALRQYVTAYFKGTGWITEDVVAAMTASPDFYASEWFQVKLPSIVNGTFASVL